MEPKSHLSGRGGAITQRTFEPERACQILGLEECQDLDASVDQRLAPYRREVFLRFYQFHLEYRAHPGAVYYAIPWLIKEHQLSKEEQFWLAFINGNTQNIVTTWLIFERFSFHPAAVGRLEKWFNENYTKLEWDIDRRHHKKDFIKAVRCYAELTEFKQTAYFNRLRGATEEETFRNVWKVLRDDFYTFGRLSSFSYSEYLRIIGYEIDCDTLFLPDLGGSKSHRNGLAKVLGRDDLDWHKDGGFDGQYQDGEITWLEREGSLLLGEARERMRTIRKVPQRDISYFTLESALCTYKSWHRKNRRYPNVYNDMFHGRLRRAEQRWGANNAAVQQFWSCREDNLPAHLRLECCPNDPGLCPQKQNYYRRTGRAIMMSKRWPEFDNDFDKCAWAAPFLRD